MWSPKIYTNSQHDFDTWIGYYTLLDQKCVYHHPAYVHALQGHFGEEAELFVFGNKKEFVYYPYLKTDLCGLPVVTDIGIDPCTVFEISSSWYYGGPILQAEEHKKEKLFLAFLKNFNEISLKNGAVTEFIRFDSNLGNHKLYGSLARYNRETVFVDLEGSENEIVQDTSSANRRALKKAEKSGLSIRAVDYRDDEAWEKFSDVYDAEMIRKDAPSHLYLDKSFLQGIRKALKEYCTLLVAEKQGNFCGGFIVVYDDRFAFHFLSATLPEYWEYRVNNLLFTNAILWARQQGCRIFDFMGGRPGVFRFKSNFSSTRGRFYTYRHVHNKNIYSALCAASNIEPNDTDYFPAYRGNV